MSDILELVSALEKWHKNNKKQLTLLVEGTEQVFVKGTNDDEIEVKGELLKGLRLGALMALEVIGELPFSIEEK